MRGRVRNAEQVRPEWTTGPPGRAGHEWILQTLQGTDDWCIGRQQVRRVQCIYANPIQSLAFAS